MDLLAWGAEGWQPPSEKSETPSHLPFFFFFKPFHLGTASGFLLACQLPSTNYNFLGYCVERDSEGIFRFSREGCCIQLVMIIPGAALKFIMGFLVYSGQRTKVLQCRDMCADPYFLDLACSQGLAGLGRESTASFLIFVPLFSPFETDKNIPVQYIAY